MGLFDKLFGKTNSNDDSSILTKTAEMLDEDLYWRIVDESLKNSNQFLPGLSRCMQF